MPKKSKIPDGKIKCPECNQIIDEGLTFCPECGKRIPEYFRFNPDSTVGNL
ncbi:MAG: zinc ribbon domain-containing protein [Candidatus Hodarchaeota archaeon]